MLSFNLSPTDIDLTGSSVLETQPVGTVVGRLSTTIPRSGDDFNYPAGPGPGGPTMLCSPLRETSSIPERRWTMRRRPIQSASASTDLNGLAVEKQFAITVGDVRDTFSISGRVWHDSDGNGVQDAGEPGLAEAVIELMDAGTASSATATTCRYANRDHG